MNHSTNFLLLAATMVGTMSVASSPASIKIGEHIAFEVFQTGNNVDSNFLRGLARNCGDENFEMALQLRIKPFAVDREKIEEDGEQALNNILKELLFEQDENGKTPVDLIEERAQATGNPDCMALYKFYNDMKWDILRAEHTKKEKEIEAAMERAQ